MIGSFFRKISKTLWGELSREEFKKFGLLSSIFFFIIGAYWLLRPLKDGIFKSLVGIEHQPKAKILSLFVIIPLVLLYSKLVDLVEKHKLFYILCTVYSIGFLSLAFLLAHPTIGLANTVASPSRILGWASYVGIESFGSIVVALFWSFVSSSMKVESAKKGFALILSGAQVGSILGPTLATNAKTLGLPLLAAIAAVGVILVMVMIKLYMTFIGDEEASVQVKSTKPKTGMMEGLKLLLTKPYLFGILAIVMLYETVGTIMDFQMKVLAAETYTTPEAFTAFMGRFGQTANGLALVLALFGTSYLMRRFGLLFCLLAFPIAMALVVGNVYLNPTLSMVFLSVVVVKGLSYALNNPAKEMMYIPTSKDVKFKAKGWIDMFGSRSAKAGGSGINSMFSGSLASLMAYGTIISMGLIGLWIVAAVFVGTKFNKLSKENKIIE